MRDIKAIIEDIKRLTEDDIAEINLQDEIEPEQPAEVIDAPIEEKPVFGDNMSLADQFDAKARIARALEALKAAVDEFKNATAEKIDLLKDQELNLGLESLDNVVIEIENALASGSKILGNSELNDPFKPELPAEQKQELDTEVEETEEEAEDEEDYVDFDDAAGLDLLNPEEA